MLQVRELLLGLVLLLLMVATEAQAARLGPEFRINSYTASAQSYPSVATLTDGGFVVTWQSNGQDGSGYGIYGQRYGQ